MNATTSGRPAAALEEVVECQDIGTVAGTRQGMLAGGGCLSVAARQGARGRLKIILLFPCCVSISLVDGEGVREVWGGER